MLLFRNRRARWTSSFRSESGTTYAHLSGVKEKQRCYFGALGPARKPPCRTRDWPAMLKSGGMTLTGCDQALDFGDRRDVTAGADSGAVEGCGGAGEFELAGQRPLLQ
jgi:hypothetical protein